MNNQQESPSPETRDLLQRILNAVEPPKKKRGFEILCAIVLSLATTASAWCAYQSKLWGGVQAARANAAMRASRDVAVSSLRAMQMRAFDASMFIAYMEARFESNQPMEEFLFQRFRPEMKAAVEAWLKQDPLNNAAAPPSPLHLAEYALKETAEMARQEEAASAAMLGSRQARGYSDDYVLLTVIFASVLFFGGIARAFDSRRLRLALMALAFTLFVGSLIVLATMPYCGQ
jgi:hypothetical protein